MRSRIEFYIIDSKTRGQVSIQQRDSVSSNLMEKHARLSCSNSQVWIKKGFRLFDTGERSWSAHVILPVDLEGI